MRISETNKISETFEFDFENSLPKGIFGQNIRDLPNGSLTADPRSSQAATLNWWSFDSVFFFGFMRKRYELYFFEEKLCNTIFNQLSTGKGKKLNKFTSKMDR